MATATRYEKELEVILGILQKLPPADQQRLVKELIAMLREERSAGERTPVAEGVTLRELHEILRSAPPLTDDEAEAFARDVREIRAEMNAHPVRDPWDS